MPTYPPRTPADYVKLSELVEELEKAHHALSSEVMRLFPKSHPAKSFLAGYLAPLGFAAKVKSGLENSVRRELGPSAPAVGLFYGPDRQQYRDQLRRTAGTRSEEAAP